MSRLLQNKRVRASWTLAFLLIVSQLLFAVAASAQTGYKLVINQIDGRGWPSIGLNITLTGPDGKAVPDVDASRFEISEEGQPQAITGMALGQARTIPLSIVLAIDVSGSMAGDKLAQAKAAAIAFLASLGPADRATLLAFNARVLEVVPSTSDHAALEQGINALQPSGNTAAFDALYRSAEIVTAAPAGARRAVILLTDGEDTSSKYSSRVAADVARQAGALVYTIGLGPDANDAVLTSLVQPGGKYYKAPSGNDLTGIYNAISLELSSQILLGYNSVTHVSRTYDLVSVQVKYTAPDGTPIVQTIRYRPPRAALVEPTPVAAIVATPFTVPLPPGVGKPAPILDIPTVNVGSTTVSTMSVLGALLVGMAVISLVAAYVVKTSPSEAALRLASYTGPLHGQAGIDSTKPPGFVNRVLAPALEGLGKRITRFSPKSYTERVEQLLRLTGPPYRLRLSGFLGIQFALSIVLLIPMLWWALRTYPTTPAQWLLTSALALAIGSYIPYFWLVRSVTNRKKALLRALPGALDFMAINVEAGMGFDSAMAEVVRRWHNPLTDEFALLLIDFQIGKPRKEAWRDLVQRTQVPDLTSFVTAMLQNEQVGSSIGHLLRVQAEHMRIRRRQRAEEAARVAPVKMLLPLVFFIFPGILVVLLGPAIAQVLDVFGNGGP
ncbi:MAG: VWA domain-containing protein [Chloroflexota bacterium]